MVADMQEEIVECQCIAFGSTTETLNTASCASLGCAMCCHIKTLGAATDDLNSLTKCCAVSAPPAAIVQL